jgi:Domain of unknown function (DUF4263)
MNKGTFFAEPGKPLRFEAIEEADAVQTPEQAGAILIADALKAYCESAHNLLAGKFSLLAEIAPRHLRTPCDITVIRCKDGVLVRYDPTSGEKPRTRAAMVDHTLREAAPPLTEFAVRFDERQSDVPTSVQGPGVELGTFDATGTFTPIHTIRTVIRASSQLPEGFQLPSPPARPVCLVSIQNDFQIRLRGVLETVDPSPHTAKGGDEHFIVDARFQLPVGWLAIECFPLLDDAFWQAANAPIWAELDILGAAALRNLQQNQLNAIDPRSEIRQRWALLLKEFEDLLQGPEEPIHQFLKRHPELISPTHVKMWSKLPFGSRQSDFVFREPSNDYELVEIEAPIRPLFRRDGQQREELTHAMNQIADWLCHLQDHKRDMEEKNGLTGISTNPRILIIIGRSDTLTDDNHRKLAALQDMIPKLRILTYDEVLAAARANLERIVGPLSLVGQNAKIYFFRP